MLSTMPLEEFLKALAARQPSPGGGAASAVAGAAGAAQAAMCAAYTTGHPRFAAVEAEAGKLRARFEEWRERFLALAERDSEAYAAVVAAQRLPKETSGQKADRRKALAAALEGARQPPAEMLAEALAVLGLLAQLPAICNPALLPDVAVAGYLLEAAARGAGMQVLANLAHPAAGATTNEHLAQTSRQLEQALKLSAAVETAVLAKMGKAAEAARLEGKG